MLRDAMSLVLLVGLGFLPVAARAANSAPASEQGATFEADGVTLWYEVRGSGTAVPLVVVNGGPGFEHSYLHCSDAWDRLAQTRRVVFYDQRGNGRSSKLKPNQACGLAEQIADLEALRARLGYEKMNLLGHSWGGYLVMAYAARYPGRISHLLIVDSAAPKIQDTVFLFKNIYPETTERENAVAFAVELGDPEAVAIDTREYISMLFYSEENRDAFKARFSPTSYRPDVNKVVWSDLQRFDLGPELPKFKFPTLVVTGRHDFNVAPSVAWGIHKAISGSEFAVFEKSGHLPFCEESDAFVSRLDRFLAKP